MSGLFSLKWKNHTTIMNEFKYFLSAEAMVDVTLACDGHRLKAHKIVLAACSPYFRSLFLENPCKHPIVVLKDVKYAELKAIIEFMYCGEVKVAEENLAAVMKTAENLSVRGLSQLRSENDERDNVYSMFANDVESSQGVMYSIDLSKWTLTRKRSPSDVSDDETYQPEIKQEPLSNDMDVNVPCSTDSTGSVYIPSKNINHYVEDQDLPVAENVDQSSALGESFEISTQNVPGQLLTTDTLPSQSIQSSVLSNTKLQNSNTEQTSSLPVPSSTVENPVPSTCVSDASVTHNQQSSSPLDSSSENFQSKSKSIYEKSQNKIEDPKKSTETPQNLEKQESQRQSLQKHKKKRHQKKRLDPSSKSLSEISMPKKLDDSEETPDNPPATSPTEDTGFWNPSLDIESPYDREAYLARFLHFGLNIQRDRVSPKRKRKQEISEANIWDTKKIIKNNELVIEEREMLEIEEQILKEDDKEMICCKCPMLESKVDILLKEHVSKDKEAEELKNLNDALTEKYKDLKWKEKNLKNSSHNDTVFSEHRTLYPTEFTVLGPSLSIDSYKLSCCRTTDFSKFTGDLLEIVFGPEILGTSVLKGIAGCKKLSVLNPDTVRDIQMYVAAKFNVPSGQVRSAIRQKLNTCHKAYKKVNGNIFDIIE